MQPTHAQVGSESLLDRSKSIKSHLMALFPPGCANVEGVDAYQACYGGTAALLACTNWVGSEAWDGRWALAVATDIRIAAREAYFRAAGINNGLTSAELGISYLLPRAIGSSRAFEIMLSGRDVDADEADRIGLVSQVVPGDALLETCYALAQRIIAYSRVGVELTKQMLWAGLDAGSLHAHMSHEGHAQLYVRLATENFEEAVLALGDPGAV